MKKHPARKIADKAEKIANTARAHAVGVTLDRLQHKAPPRFPFNHYERTAQTYADKAELFATRAHEAALRGERNQDPHAEQNAALAFDLVKTYTAKARIIEYNPTT